MAGRSHECDFPAGVGALPVCTEAKLDARRPSGDIDRSVRQILEQALSVYRVDPERLASLCPTHIVTQTQFEVWSVSQRDVETALADWIGTRPALVALEAADLEGAFADVRRVAAALSEPERGEELVARLRWRIQDVSIRTAALASRPRVAWSIQSKWRRRGHSSARGVRI